MHKKTAPPSLLPVPRILDQAEEDRLPHARKIFALRDVPFGEIKALGFDMDYTLSHYRSPEIDELAFRHATAYLVQGRGYPAELLTHGFDPSFAVRGLVLDGVRGNLLKLNRERQVVRATHGTAVLEREEILEMYSRRRVSAGEPGFRSIDTLFEISESHLYAHLVDLHDLGRLPGRGYQQIFSDVRWAIDAAHREGKMKAEVLANRSLFILKDPDLARALDRWKRAGKKLFVVSNSEWAFTEGVLSHLLDGQDPARPSWEDYFDLVVVSSRKPAFFTEEPLPEALEGHPRAFSGGNAHWLEAQLGAQGEELLYVGDHIYGDILRSKKSLSWRTMLLIPELGEALQRLEECAEELLELMKAETVRRRALRQGAMLRDLLKRNREHRHLLAQRLSPEALRALDLEARSLEADAQGQTLRVRVQEELIAGLTERLERAFNHNWGSIFRDGYEQTRFADQIQQYACAYTGRISNLYMVDPESTLYAPVPMLPHERV
ncbi:MAG: HAD-IG family 5'-nucleotidase [Acidobacteria bacterium]|nr:HAD-IG family 5'-nucleotidase [Acidobacteriota bacterium]